MSKNTAVKTTAGARIESRGNPDGPTIHGEEVELVHYKIYSPKNDVNGNYPACRNGAFNIRWTDRRKLVTCPKCRAGS